MVKMGRDDLHDLRDRYRSERDLSPHDGPFLNLCIEGISVLFWAFVSNPHPTKRRLLQWSQSKQAEPLLALGLHRYSLQVVRPRHTTRIRSPSLPFHSRKPGRRGKYESFGHYNGPQDEFRSCSEGRLVHGKRHRIDAKCFVDFPLVSIWIGGRADMERVAAPGFEDAGRAHLAPKDPPERRPA